MPNKVLWCLLSSDLVEELWPKSLLAGVNWITLCMHKYVNSARVYYPLQGCIIPVRPAPNCISWLLCSFCCCHTMKQGRWGFLGFFYFYFFNPDLGLCQLQRIAQMYHAGFVGGRLTWWNLRKKQKAWSFIFPTEIPYLMIEITPLMFLTKCIQWCCGQFLQSCHYLHFRLWI